MTEDEDSHAQKRSHAAVKAEPRRPAPIWWSNAIFFCGMHVLALAGILYLSPWRTLDRRTAWFVFWPRTRLIGPGFASRAGRSRRSGA